jgi:putative inorganic carbon (hco3(-)) transporter
VTAVAHTGDADLAEPQRSGLERASALAIWATVATIPWAGVIDVGGGTIAKAVGLAAAPLAIVALWLEGVPRRLLGTHKLAIAFAVWAAASLVWTVDPERTTARGISALQFAALLVLAWQCGPLSRRTSLVHAYVAGSAVTCAVVLGAWASGSEVERYTSGATHPNDVAYILVLAVPMAWYAGVTATGALRALLMRAFVPIAIFCALLTASRSALLLLPVALLVVPLTAGRLRVTGRGLVLVAGLGCALLAPTLLPADVVDRLGTAQSELTSGTLNERERLWNAAQRTVEDEPLHGVGAGASRVRMAEYLPEGAVPQGAHNTFLSVAAELGVVGLLLFGLLLLSAVVDGLQAPEDAARLAFVLALLLAIGLQVRHWEYTKALWAVLAVLVELKLTIPRHEVARRRGVHSPHPDGPSGWISA